MILILTLRAHIEQWSMDQVFVSACDVCRFSAKHKPNGIAISNIRCCSLSGNHFAFALPFSLLFSNTRTHSKTTSALESFIHAMAKPWNAHNDANENTFSDSSQHTQHKLYAYTRAMNGERWTVYGHQHHSGCVVAVFDEHTTDGSAFIQFSCLQTFVPNGCS